MDFKINNYIVIPGFAITEFKLSGNELICYSLIYGFSQDDETEFAGSLAYLSSALNVTKSNAKNIVDRLIGKGLIIKREEIVRGIKFCYYKAVMLNDKQNNTTGTETIPPVLKQYHPVTETITDNNNIYNNKEEKNLYNNIEVKKEKKSLFRNSGIYQLADFNDKGEISSLSRLIEHFKGDEYRDIDFCYYFHTINDWSETSQTMRTDRGWLATFRTFMREDRNKGKLHKIFSDNSGIDYNSALQFLNDDF